MITRSGRRGAAAHLVKEGIDLYSRHIFVRHYDDVLGRVTSFVSRDRRHADHVTRRCPPVDDVLGEEYAEYLDYRQYDDAFSLSDLRPSRPDVTPSSNFRRAWQRDQARSWRSSAVRTRQCRIYELN